jgi:hypothetical protein
MVQDYQATSRAKTPRNPSRKVICFPIPESEMASFTPTVIQAIIQRIVQRLYITQHIAESFVSKDGRLTLCLFHGDAPQQSIETFDKQVGHPRRQRYTPNKKLMLVVDPKQHFFYLAVDKKDLLKVLQSLNETLFPQRKEGEPFATIRPNLEQFPYLFSSAYAPSSRTTVYTALRLKGFTARGAGVNPMRVKFDWSIDGFDAVNLGLVPYIKRVQSVRLEVDVRHYDTPFTMTLYRDAGAISVQLSEKTFDVIPEILKLCTEGLSARQVLPYNPQGEFDFPARG